MDLVETIQRAIADFVNAKDDPPLSWTLLYSHRKACAEAVAKAVDGHADVRVATLLGETRRLLYPVHNARQKLVSLTAPYRLRIAMGEPVDDGTRNVVFAVDALCAAQLPVTDFLWAEVEKFSPDLFPKADEQSPDQKGAENG